MRIFAAVFLSAPCLLALAVSAHNEPTETSHSNDVILTASSIAAHNDAYAPRRHIWDVVNELEARGHATTTPKIDELEADEAFAPKDFPGEPIFPPPALANAPDSTDLTPRTCDTCANFSPEPRARIDTAKRHFWTSFTVYGRDWHMHERSQLGMKTLYDDLISNLKLCGKVRHQTYNTLIAGGEWDFQISAQIKKWHHNKNETLNCFDWGIHDVGGPEHAVLKPF